MKYIYLFLKGIPCGASLLIPGLGGSAAAMALGEFENIISAVSAVFKHPVAALKYLLPLLSGGLLSIVLFSKLILILKAARPVLCAVFFVLISVGCIVYMVLKETRGLKLHDIILIACGFLSGYLINCLLSVMSLSLTSPLFLIFAGILLAAAIVMPGISFSYMLMSFSIYDLFLSSFTAPNASFILPLLCGIAIGLILFSALFMKFIHKHRRAFYAAVIGFMLFSTVYAIIKEISDENINIFLTFITNYML